MKTFLTLVSFLLITFISFSQKIMFEVYRVDLYKKSGLSNLNTPISDYDLIKEDIDLKEIFIFDLDSSILEISSYPNTESHTKRFKINSIEKINDSITIKSKINLKDINIYHDFTSHFNIDDDESYIHLLFYDEIKNETTFLNVNHFNLRKSF